MSTRAMPGSLQPLSGIAEPVDDQTDLLKVLAADFNCGHNVLLCDLEKVI